MAVVGRQIGGQFLPQMASRRVDLMVDQQQLPRLQPPDEKPCIGASPPGVFAGRPRAATIRRKTLPDTEIGPHQHPQPTVLSFNQHVLVEPPLRHGDPADELEGPTLVAGHRHIRPALGQ